MHAVANLCGYLLRIFSSADSLSDSAIEMYGGLTNLTFIIVGSILITLGCVYLLKKAFEEKRHLAVHTRGYNL